ncbi:hypothetical protein SAMN05428978_10717 [Nitrosomonas sp. Nm34]|nr:hypothetical protein SAMN05428978_10717 [Nitrosomonas sp. Nm34]
MTFENHIVWSDSSTNLPQIKAIGSEWSRVFKVQNNNFRLNGINHIIARLISAVAVETLIDFTIESIFSNFSSTQDRFCFILRFDPLALRD